MLKDLFGKKKKYATVPTQSPKGEVPEGIMVKCDACKKMMYTKEFMKNLKVCLHCKHHHSMHALERIDSLVDEESFFLFENQIETINPLQFPNYKEKIEADKIKTGLDEAVITGYATILGNPVVIAVMDSRFRMGSMGSVVGEKITRAVNEAKARKVPFIIFTASGGARMQEGILSLMQMAKTSVALKHFHDEGGLFISVMTHPTTGGVSASFASLGDYNFAEPKALIGFAGRRVIEQTVREELPEDFQSAEFLLKHGQLDAVIPRNEMKKKLGFILSLHQGGEIYA